MTDVNELQERVRLLVEDRNELKRQLDALEAEWGKKIVEMREAYWAADRGVNEARDEVLRAFGVEFKEDDNWR